jgi:hypothetical protein
LLCKTFFLLNAELNLICHLLAILEAHPILHISRIRVIAVCLLLFMFLVLTARTAELLVLLQNDTLTVSFRVFMYKLQSAVGRGRANWPDHDQQHCYHQAPTGNQRLLLQLL